MDTSDPNIVFDDMGMCNHCKSQFEMWDHVRYSFHRSHYQRFRMHNLPRMSVLAKGHLGPAVARRYGNDKAWFIAHTSPLSSEALVQGSNVDFDMLYEEKIKAKTLLNTIHNYLLNSLVYSTGNLIGRSARASGLEIVFPYLYRPLMRKCLDCNPLARINKAPIRKLMRQAFAFPKELASRGENWGEKIGWGGTIVSYIQDKAYADAIRPDMSVARYWFTEAGLMTLSCLETQPRSYALNMDLFFKTLGLVH